MSQAMEIHQEKNMPAPAEGPDQFVSMLERVANNPDIPIDRLEKMLALKERQEDRLRSQMQEDREYAAKRAFFTAMSKCQKEIPVVSKTRTNTHTKSTYADLAAIEEQAMPVIHSNGFAVSFQPDGYNDKGELRILWEISHEEGHFRSGVGEIPVDGAGSQGKVNKTSTQAFGSTATYGRRYLLCMLFNISTGDDTDGNTPQVSATITEQQANELRGLIEKAQTTEEKFCEFGQVASLMDIAVNNFAAAKETLLARVKKVEAKQPAANPNAQFDQMERDNG